MKLAVISDIHGNIEALNNCYRFIGLQKVDRIYSLGDAIGYLPYSLQVIDFLKKQNIHCIKGNHEAILLGELPIKDESKEVYKLDIVSSNMNTFQSNYLRSWKEKEILKIHNKKYLLIHGSPVDHLNGYIYPDTNLNLFDTIPFDIIIMGHTHRPFIRHENNKIFINPGSVGLPRDYGTLSSCCIINTDPLNINIYRIPFSINSFLMENQINLIHPSIIACMKRIDNDYFGKIII